MYVVCKFYSGIFHGRNAPKNTIFQVRPILHLLQIFGIDASSHPKLASLSAKRSHTFLSFASSTFATENLIHISSLLGPAIFVANEPVSFLVTTSRQKNSAGNVTTPASMANLRLTSMAFTPLKRCFTNAKKPP